MKKDLMLDWESKYDCNNRLWKRKPIQSYQRSKKYLGVEFKIMKKVKILILITNKIILPGVGAFGDAMHRIKLKNFYNVLCKANNKKIPILGICLGMQLLHTRSFEFLKTNGFNFYSGEVRKHIR